jgi:ABC-type bacteriocin/lantibiotic exporter with double-glycine peptidase domain
MKKFKNEFLERLTHLPTTTIGFIILLIGFAMVIFDKISMTDLIAFCAMSVPWFFAKKESDDKDKDKETE